MPIRWQGVKSMKNIMKAIVPLMLVCGPMTSDGFAKSWVEGSGADRRVSTQVVKDDMIIMRTDESFKEVRVANAKIADVVVLTDRSFHIFGKEGGKTNVMLYGDNNRLLDIIDVKVGFDMPGLKKSLYEAFPHEEIEVHSMAGGLYVSGDVSSLSISERAVKIAEAYAPGKVTNGLAIRDSHQVMLEVKFIEASRNVVKEMGLGMLTSRAGDFALQTGTGLISGRAPSLSGVLTGASGAVSIENTLQALEEQGVVRTLAEPNLVAMSGDTASFLAGGEFPIPVAADEGQIAIEFRQFGVGLAFTPTVRGDGVINLKVMPEVSQIDSSNAVRLQGVEVPSLRVRRADTTVELRNSQSFAIAGLLQNEHSTGKIQVPWLGDVPVLGSLFRSSRYKNNETELVIIVTPRLVQPASDISDLTTPLDGMSSPNEVELFLHGKLETSQSAGGLTGTYGSTLR